MPGALEIRAGARERYADVYTPAALAALEALAPLDRDRRAADGGAHRAAARGEPRPASASPSSIPTR